MRSKSKIQEQFRRINIARKRIDELRWDYLHFMQWDEWDRSYNDLNLMRNLEDHLRRCLSITNQAKD